VGWLENGMRRGTSPAGGFLRPELGSRRRFRPFGFDEGSWVVSFLTVVCVGVFFGFILAKKSYLKRRGSGGLDGW